MFGLNKEKLFLVKHLSLMIEGGTSLTEALNILKGEVKSRSLKKALKDILKRSLKGAPLNKSLAYYPNLFSKFFCGVVKAGEESGTLDVNLKYLAEQLRKTYETQRRIIGTLIYPILLIFFALAIVFFSSFWLMPKVINLFQTMNIALPLPTQILIKCSSFFTQNWKWILGGLILFIMGLNLLRKIPLAGFFIDKTFLSLPAIGKIQKNLNLARFSRIFYTLFKSGIPVFEALSICVDAIPNRVYKKSIKEIKVEVERGMQISRSLKRQSKFFSPVYAQMVLVGERSGKLEDSFLYLAEFYEEETKTLLRNISNIIGPCLLIIIGILVGFIAVSVLLPIWKFTSSLRIPR